jgi:hypothetical protein
MVSELSTYEASMKTTVICATMSASIPPFYPFLPRLYFHFRYTGAPFGNYTVYVVDEADEKMILDVKSLIQKEQGYVGKSIGKKHYHKREGFHCLLTSQTLLQVRDHPAVLEVYPDRSMSQSDVESGSVI